MKITYEIEKKDLWNFNKYVIMNVPVFKRSYLTSIIATPVLIFIFARMAHLKPYLIFLTTVFGGLLGAYLIILLSKYQLYKSIGSGEGIIGKHTIEIEQKGLKEITEYNEAFIKWSGIKSVESDKNYIYIFIGTHTAHIIPKKYFETKEESEKFMNLLLKYCKRNK